MLAEADHHHLQQAALDRPVIAGVRLDAGDDADVVGAGGVTVEHDRKAFRRGAELDDLHRRLDRHADERLGDAVAFEKVLLPLGGGAAVAAHRRHEERLRAEFLQIVGRGAKDERDVGDAAAAGRQGDGLARPDPAHQLEFLESARYRSRDVVNARRSNC